MFKRIIKIFIPVLLVTSGAAIILYYFISSYVIGEAKEHIKNVLLSNRGLHLYIQRNMLPTYYHDRECGYISLNYYNPVLLSSSFMVRVLNNYSNEERRKQGLSEVYYKMAAVNPRNPLNLADDYESRILEFFNLQRNVKEREEIVTIDDKKYIYYSIPFLETTKACLRCHGRRKDAPPGLQRLYPGEGGFGDKVGNIRAIESIRVPVDEEILKSFIITGSATSGLAALLILFVFSSQLRQRVKDKTIDLELEVAENVKAKEEIERSLKEKEILLKEVHHRVKNNMAIISSLLELQSMTADDKHFTLMLNDCQHRIKSMALIHEKLYLSGDLTNINVRDYINELISDLAVSFGFGDKTSLAKLDIDDVEMHLDQMIHLGLMINEIVINSFKHAFNGIDNPEIFIILKAEGGIINLIVADNGVGIKKHNVHGKSTLGLEIIHSLSAGLKCEMKVDGNNGTSYSFRFSHKKKNSVGYEKKSSDS